MAQQTLPEETGTTAKKSPLIVGALLAGVLGLGVGAGLVWMGSGGKTVADAGSGQCAFSDAERARMDAAGQGEVAAFRALDRPYSAQQVSFKDKDGNPKTLADWQGRTVLMNLWATWCAPCRAEMPALDELQAEMGGENFEVVAVSVDLGEADKPKKFYKDIGIKHMAFYHDGDMAPLNTLKKAGLAYGLPATLLIDGNGCVLGALNGPAEWASDDAKALVRAGM
ncbi:MAG: TlpA disulfide reductase family protein [Pseudomonadota bacterium]